MRGRKHFDQQTSDSVYSPIIDALLRPQRIPYSEFSLPAALSSQLEDGGEGTPIERIDEEIVVRADSVDPISYTSSQNRPEYMSDSNMSGSQHNKQNNPGEITLHMSSYIAPQRTKEVVIYLHTHSGMRVEGVEVARRVVAKGYGAVIYDSRGNGHSTGNSVSFGWNEAADLEIVIRHLRKHHGVKSIFLWGRSMGAATAIFYQSVKFRSSHPITFHYLYPCVKGLILDSPFTDLRENIKTFVASKAAAVPGFMVDIALSLIEADVKKEIGVGLAQVSPVNFFDGLRLPTFVISSDNDEMVKLEEIEGLFRNVRSSVKKLRIARGTHSEERPEFIMKQAAEFVDLVFKLSRGKENASFNKSTSHLGTSYHVRHPVKPEATTNVWQQPTISKQSVLAIKTPNSHTIHQTGYQMPKQSIQPFDRATHLKGTAFDTNADPFGEFPQRWANDVTEISEELGYTEHHPKNTTLREGPVLNQRKPLVEPTMLKAYSNDPNFGHVPPVRLDLMTPIKNPEENEINQSSRSKSYLTSKQSRHIPLVQPSDQEPQDMIYRDHSNPVPAQHTQHPDHGLGKPSQGITDSSNFMDSSRQSGSRERERSRRRNPSNVKINLKPTQALPPQPPLPKSQQTALQSGVSAQKYLTNDFANLPLSDDSSEERNGRNPDLSAQLRTQQALNPPLHSRRGQSPAFEAADAYPDPFAEGPAPHTPLKHPGWRPHNFMRD